MPTRVARVSINFRWSTREQHYFYMCGEVTEAAYLQDVLLGDEEEEVVDTPKVIAVAGNVIPSAMLDCGTS